jgi:hypothetical protein
MLIPSLTPSYATSHTKSNETFARCLASQYRVSLRSNKFAHHALYYLSSKEWKNRSHYCLTHLKSTEKLSPQCHLEANARSVTEIALDWKKIVAHICRVKCQKSKKINAHENNCIMSRCQLFCIVCWIILQRKSATALHVCKELKYY